MRNYYQSHPILEDEIRSLGALFEACRRERISIHSIPAIPEKFERVMEWVAVSKMSRMQFNYYLTEGAKEIHS